MDSETQIPLKKSSSHKIKYCCLFSFILFSILLLTSSILLILLILKPKKPTFHLHSIHLDPIKLDASSGKGVFLPASMASLFFVTQNSNKFGIRYGSSNLGMIYESNPVGVIQVPEFYQPPNGINVMVIMHVLLERLNITRFISVTTESNDSSSSNGAPVEVQLVGLVEARVHVINFSLPTIKVCLDCRINVDYGAETFSKGLMFMNAHKALILSKFPSFSQKCSITLCL